MKNILRSVSMFLVITLLLTCQPGFSETTRQEPLQDMCAMGDKLFLARSNALYMRVRDADGMNDQLVETLIGLKGLDDEEDKLYALCTAMGKNEVYVYDGSGTRLDEISISLKSEPFGFAVADHTLCFLLWEGSGSALYLYDMTTHQLSRNELLRNPEYISAVANRIAVLCESYDGGYPVLAIEYLDEKRTDTAMEMPPYGTIALHPTEDICVIWDGQQLVCLSWENGKNHCLRVKDFVSADVSALLDWDENQLVAWNQNVGQAAMCDLEQLQAEQSSPLVIAGSMLPDLEGIVDPPELRDQYNIHMRSFANEEQFLLALMAGESDIDLLYLNNFWYARYVRANMLLDLNEFECIRQLSSQEDALSWPYHLIETEGRLLALPVDSPIIEMWAVNEDLLNRSGMALPNEDWTWQDFLQMARSYRDSGVGDIALNDSYSQRFYVNYINTYVDTCTGRIMIDTPEFREALNVWKALEEEQMVVYNGEEEALFETVGVSLCQEERTIIYPPAFSKDSQRVLDAEMNLLGVYAGTADAERAVEYLAMLFQKETQASARVIPAVYYNDRSMYLRGSEGDVDQRFFDWYVKAVQYVSPRDEIRDIKLAVFEAARRYINGEADMDQVISQIEQGVDIILNE